MGSTAFHHQDDSHRDAANLASWRLSLFKRRHSHDVQVERNLNRKLSSLSQAFRGPVFRDGLQPYSISEHKQEDTSQPVPDAGLQEISSEYNISGTLGSGVSATVHRATHHETGKEMALKVFDDASSIGVQAAMTEFECGVRAAGEYAIEHYNLALMNGHPTIVMELAQQSLHDWIQGFRSPVPGADTSNGGSALSPFSSCSDGGTPIGSVTATVDDTSSKGARSMRGLQEGLPPACDIMRFMSAILQGLKVVHEVGLAHCDIKPQNVVLTYDGRAKLADFGAACAINPSTGILATVDRPYTAAAYEQDIGAEPPTKNGNIAAGEPGPARDPRDSTGSKPSMRSLRDSLSLVMDSLQKHPSSCCTGGMLHHRDRSSSDVAALDNSSAFEDEAPTNQPGLMMMLPPRRQRPSDVSQNSLSSDFGPTAVSDAQQAAPFQGVRSLRAEPMAMGLNWPRRESTASVPEWQIVRCRSSSLRDVPMLTTQYSSPERSKTADQRKVDVWSAGCILYEFCTGVPLMRPKSSENIHGLMAQMFDVNWTTPKLPKCMRRFQGLLDAMLCRDPDQRLLPVELLRLDLFRSSNNGS